MNVFELTHKITHATYTKMHTYVCVKQILFWNLPFKTMSYSFQNISMLVMLVRKISPLLYIDINSNFSYGYYWLV